MSILKKTSSSSVFCAKHGIYLTVGDTCPGCDAAQSERHRITSTLQVEYAEDLAGTRPVLVDLERVLEIIESRGH
jgi:hypothetical protein